jgi:hypothetical protein
MTNFVVAPTSPSGNGEAYFGQAALQGVAALSPGD